MRRGSIAVEQFVAVGIALTVIVIILLGAATKIWPGFMQFLGVAGLDNETGTGSLIARAWTDFDESGQLQFHLVEGSGITRARAQDTFGVYELFDADPFVQPLCQLEQLQTMSPRMFPQGAGGGTFDIDWTLTQSPGAFGTRWLCIRVYDDNAADLQNPPLLVRINSWQFLLNTYLNTPMFLLNSPFISAPQGSAIRWSLAMHRNPPGAFWDNYPSDQSLLLSDAEWREVHDFLGLATSGIPNTIPDIPALTSGTFKDFLNKLPCASPDLNSGATGVKKRALQTVVTALFGDIQDFESASGRPATPGQPVPRLRDGTGPRGWQSGAYANQLYPLEIGVWYPEMAVGGNLAWNPEAMVRARTNAWIGDDAFYGKPYSAQMDFPGTGCLAGKTMTIYLRACTACGGG